MTFRACLASCAPSDVQVEECSVAVLPQTSAACGDLEVGVARDNSLALALYAQNDRLLDLAPPVMAVTEHAELECVQIEVFHSSRSAFWAYGLGRGNDTFSTLESRFTREKIL